MSNSYLAGEATLALIVALAAGSPQPAPGTSAQKGYQQTLHHCQQVENPVLVPGSSLYVLEPMHILRKGLDKRWRPQGDTRIRVKQAPAGGALREEKARRGTGETETIFVFNPRPGFRGIDQLQLVAERGAARYLIEITLQIVETTADGACTPELPARRRPAP